MRNGLGTGVERECVNGGKEQFLVAAIPLITYPVSQLQSTFPGPLGIVPVRQLAQVQVGLLEKQKNAEEAECSLILRRLPRDVHLPQDKGMFR